MAVTRLADHLVGGTHAARPAATAVPVGTLYSCTDHSLIYQSDGASWSTYATLGASPLTTKGDLYGYSTGNDRLAVGTDGQVLSASSGAATGLAWADPSAEPLTTKGDVYVYSSTPTRLAVGSDGQTLVADSATTEGVAWANPATGLDNPALYADRRNPPLGSYGYEFGSSYTNTLPSGFSWVNEGDGNYVEAADNAMLFAANTGGTTSATETHRMIVRSFPSESAFSVELCMPDLLGKQGTNTRGGMVIRDSTSGKYVTFGRVVTDGNMGRVRVETWSALNTLDAVQDEALLASVPTNFRIKQTSSTSWSMQVGAGGNYSSYMFDGSTFDPTALVASFDQIGFYAGTPNTLADGTGISVKWLRFTT